MTYEELLKERNQLQGNLKTNSLLLHDAYISKYKRRVRFTDYLLAAAIVLNFFTFLITNSLVVKETIEVKGEDALVFVEANPVQAEIQGFETTPEANTRYWGFIALMGAYVVFIVAYSLTRSKLMNHWDYAQILAFTLALFIMIATNFFSDLGMFIGTII